MFQMTNTFKQWMKDTYDKQELSDIALHGCTGGVSGMIYYTETCALYDKHAEELHDALDDFEQQTGSAPEFLLEHIGCLTSFKNAVLWAVAEMYAQDMTVELETE